MDPVSRNNAQGRLTTVTHCWKTKSPACSIKACKNMFVEDMTSIPEQAHWNCVRKGKLHVPEIFAGTRFSQRCALTGLKVGTPVDIRNGFDVMTSKGRHMVMEIIKEQAPDLILMAPVCGPWSNMQNIRQDQQKVWEKRQRYIPMVGFAASIARHQLKHERYFIIEIALRAATLFRSIRDLGRFPFLRTD